MVSRKIQYEILFNRIDFIQSLNHKYVCNQRIHSHMRGDSYARKGKSIQSEGEKLTFIINVMAIFI